MEIKKLIKEAHENAVAHGWWDIEQPFENQIVNMHCELSEAWEDYRNNRGLNEFYFECKAPGACPNSITLSDCNKCQYNKPCGIPVELGDVCIRIFDTLGKMEVDADELEYVLHDKPKSFGEFIARSHGGLSFAWVLNDKDVANNLFGVIKYIETYCQDNSIDLEKAIKLKMAYNRNRPYRHGGKRA